MDAVRLERVGLVAAVLLLVVLPTVLHGWSATWRDVAYLGLLVAGALALLWWRSHARVTVVLAMSAYLAAIVVDPGGWFPDGAGVLFSLTFVVAALAWSGRAAVVAAVGVAAYLVPFILVSGPSNLVGGLMFTVPPFVAGTVLRLRRETAAELGRRARELEEEQELYAAIALRHERARIAGELHDIVGHAISVMVIQAAAGQRLAAADPARAREAFAAISESARQGSADLDRLVELLDGGPDDTAGGPDLSVVEELVTRAARSGLRVTCRYVGDHDRVPAPVAHAAFRVVQESLTNALKHAPGSAVRIAIEVGHDEPLLLVRVENDESTAPASGLVGAGHGLLGLRERVQRLGGQLSAGRTPQGWTVEARLPVGTRLAGS